jgi:IclR family pca regulon transcriptional regulator
VRNAHQDRANASPDNETTTTIQSVERAARILSFFTVSRPRLTLSEMTARLGVSKATAHRYAMALRRVNLLRYDRAAADYTLGPQVLTLGAVARAGLPIITLAGPFMEQLVSEVNETVVLSVWDGEAPVVVRVDDSTERVVRISVRSGSRLSTIDSAQGKLFCAFLRRADITPELASEIGGKTALKAELAAIREAGLAVNTPEIHGVRTIAAPVFSDGNIVAVMGVVGTTATVSDDLTSHTALALARVAAELSRQFGDHLASPD